MTGFFCLPKGEKKNEKSIRCVYSDYNVQDIIYIYLSVYLSIYLYFLFFFPDGSSNQGLNTKKNWNTTNSSLKITFVYASEKHRMEDK